MPTSTLQILCKFIRADVGIRPYDADFNATVNYNLSEYISKRVTKNTAVSFSNVSEESRRC